MTDQSAGARAVLSQPYRRHICEYLSSNDDLVVTLEELTRAVADAEPAANGTTVAEVDDRHIATTLHHVHLPKLDHVGVLEYDPDRRTATADSGLPAVLELLRVLADRPARTDLRS